MPFGLLVHNQLLVRLPAGVSFYFSPGYLFPQLIYPFRRMSRGEAQARRSLARMQPVASACGRAHASRRALPTFNPGAGSKALDQASHTNSFRGRIRNVCVIPYSSFFSRYFEGIPLTKYIAIDPGCTLRTFDRFRLVKFS